MTAARVLVVEDEESIRGPVARALRSAGYQVHELADGADFETEVTGFRPDLAVLDVMLPGRDGFELSRALRSRMNAGVLMLTARDGIPDRVRGLESGADDYVSKPFAMEELLARVASILRRLGRTPATLEIGDLVVDEGAGVALREGHSVELTATEFRLLSFLAHNRGRTLSKTQILTQVWGYEEYDPNLVEVHVSALRRKLEQYGPRLIHTVRGMGYVLRP